MGSDSRQSLSQRHWRTNHKPGRASAIGWTYHTPPPVRNQPAAGCLLENSAKNQIKVNLLFASELICVILLIGFILLAAFTRLRNLTLKVPRHNRLAGQGAILETQLIEPVENQEVRMHAHEAL